MSRIPIGALALVAALLPACGAAPAGGAGAALQVVAGENFWGDIAARIGGDGVAVQSVVSDPNADPHEYESSANDARAFATARLVILNGAGYDDWGRKLLAANPSSTRKVLVVADALGKRAGDNPHFWYDPVSVVRVADAITAAYRSLSPGRASYFDQRRAAFADELQPYDQRLTEIRARFAGTPVGATESVFVYMARYLGLDLVSPAEFMNAVAQGNDPPARSVAAFRDQLAGRRVKVVVYDVQTATRLTSGMTDLARQNGIPVVGVSETMQPAGGSFVDWQDRQLAALETALASAARPQ